MNDTLNSKIGNQKSEIETRDFDWEGMRQRIATAGMALSGLDETAPEVLQEVWARRAAQLARVPVEEERGEQIDLVLVRLGRELYGLNAQHVADIKPLEQITRVPRVPDWVAGVVNLRGRIYSVVNLRRFFGLAGAERDGNDRKRSDETRSLGENGFLVVVEVPAMEVALLVEDVLNVEALPANQIQEATGTVRGLRPEYVHGVAERRNRDATRSSSTDGNLAKVSASSNAMLIVLNLPALLADERLIVHEEIT
jgi:purine-binding chemotaxis protein CheW